MEQLREALNSLGGWPVVVGNSWNLYNNSFDWISVIAKMRELGFRTDMFIQFKVIADVLNNTKRILFVSY